MNLKLICLTFLVASSIVSGADLPFGFKEKLLAEKLDATFVTAHEDQVFFTEKSGLIHIIDNGVLSTTPFLDIRDRVDNGNERGLQSIALHPDYNTNGYVYVYYTRLGENRNGVSRFTASGLTADSGSEDVIATFDTLVANIHNGGALLFKDGYLFVNTGDAANPEEAMKLTSSLGKVMRFNDDGSIPTDNPFYNTASGDYRSIYAYGFRNPYGSSLNPRTEEIYIIEVGLALAEEIDLLVAGADYGWPLVEGKKKEGQTVAANYEDPIFAYGHGGGYCAITGGTFYTPTTVQFPAEYDGKFLFGDYCAGTVRVFDPDTKKVTGTFMSGLQQAVAFAVDDDGRFYYITRGSPDTVVEQTQSCCGELLMVEYTGDGTPTVASQPKDYLTVAGRKATFSVRPSGSPPFEYQWKVDGVNIPGATSRKYEKTTSLSDNGKVYTVKITNKYGTITSDGATLSVVADRNLKAVITLPTSGSKYSAGTTLSYSGYGEDDNGQIADSGHTWEIVFHHNEHTHPALPATSGSKTGTYSLSSAHEAALNVWYRIHLTVEDERGITAKTYVDIHPNLATVTLRTSPSGLVLQLDHAKVIAPMSFVATVGISRNVIADDQTIDGKIYTFASWSSGEAADHNFNIPATDTTYTATYTQSGTVPNGLNYKYYEGSWTTIPDFTGLTADKSGTVDNIDTSDKDLTSGFAFEFTGYLYLEDELEYTFYLASNDGSKLYINGIEIIDNDGVHTYRERSASLVLRKGSHSIKVEHFTSTVPTKEISLKYSSSKTDKRTIQDSLLYTSDPSPCSSQVLAYRPKFKEYYYADEDIYVGAYSSSKLTVTYDVEGPGEMFYEGGTPYLSLKGSGTVTVYARQAGNVIFCPAYSLAHVFDIKYNRITRIVLAVVLPLIAIGLLWAGIRVYKKKGFKKAFCSEKKKKVSVNNPKGHQELNIESKNNVSEIDEVKKPAKEDLQLQQREFLKSDSKQAMLNHEAPVEKEDNSLYAQDEKDSKILEFPDIEANQSKEE